MAPHLIFGGASIGSTESSFTFTWDTPARVTEVLDLLERLGVTEIDSAATYPPTNSWNSEILLGQCRAAQRGFIIDGKILIRHGQPFLRADMIEESLERSLVLLGVSRVRVLYAHINDGVTPLEDQLATFDKLYRAGKFEKLGFSNYSPADMERLFAISEEKGYVKPSVYEGLYNALSRESEDDLFPMLRRHNCTFNAYSPLAGGFLTGMVTRAVDSGDMSDLEGTRWYGYSQFPIFARLYDLPPMHAAIHRLQAACDAAWPPLTLQEASLRWIMYHSPLTSDDGVIFGADNLEQIESNIADIRRGPLPEAVLGVMNSLLS